MSCFISISKARKTGIYQIFDILYNIIRIYVSNCKKKKKVDLRNKGLLFGFKECCKLYKNVEQR